MESPSIIRNAVCNIEDTVEVLSQSISVLEKRLDTVLTPPSPAVAGSPAPPSNVSSDVHQRLSNVLSRLQSLNRWVNVLNDRVEV